MPAGNRVRVAVLDMNMGTENLGLPSILGILDEASTQFGMPQFDYELFDVRAKSEIPDLSFEIYISTGGPGSPFDGRGKRWEANYFNWLDALWSHNENADEPKHALFICHSFEMMCDFFGVAEITRRRSPSFGIFPVHMDAPGLIDPLFRNVENPFLAADFRDWQAVSSNQMRMDELGASVLAREKIRPHVPLERAVMAIRVSRSLVGVQFHPEAAPDGMKRHFKSPERRLGIIDEYGIETFEAMVALLQDPSSLSATRESVIPNFLRHAAGVTYTLDVGAKEHR